MEKVEHQKLVGPVIRGIDQEIIEALLIAIADDKPDAELFYEDHSGYVRIHTLWRCRVTRKSMEAALGRSFRLSELEPSWDSLSCLSATSWPLPGGCALWAMRNLSGIWNGRISCGNSTPARASQNVESFGRCAKKAHRV